MRIVLKNGNVVTDKVEQTNVIINGETIEAVTNELPQADQIIDCTGKYIVPGLIDMHVHLREPGQEYKETIESGSTAAARGGVTTMCCMANTNPVVDDSSLASWIVNRGKEVGLCDIMPFGCVTKGMKGEELTDMGDILSMGAAGFSDDGKPILRGEVMRRALEYAKYFGSFIACHEEETSLFNSGSIHEGRVSTLTGLRAAPAEAESIMVSRDIELARLTGGRVHICHVSSLHSVEHIRRGKEAGINVTAEVTPNHLDLTDEICMSYHTNTKVNPPVRSETDRQALIKALKDGVIDCVASDHAPHHLDDKFVEYDLAAFGIIGLQLTVPLMIKRINEKSLTWVDFARVTSSKPAEILGIESKGKIAAGMLADIAVINPDAEYIFDDSVNASFSKNTPYWGQKLRGRAENVIKSGRILF